MSPITPVILCGGSGTRLWPLSRQSYPKQFTALVDAKACSSPARALWARRAIFAAARWC